MPGTGNARGGGTRGGAGGSGRGESPGKKVKEEGLTPKLPSLPGRPFRGVAIMGERVGRKSCGCLWVPPSLQIFQQSLFSRRNKCGRGGFSNDHKKECHPDVKGLGMRRMREDVGPRGLIPSGPPGASPSSWGLWSRKSLRE